MPSPELQELESVDPPKEKRPINERYTRLINHNAAPVNDNLQRQAQLAVEQYRRDNPGMTIDDGDTLQNIMMAWSDKDSPSHYSEYWRHFINHPDFKDPSKRYKGNFANVSLANLEEFIRNEEKTLPD